MKSEYIFVNSKISLKQVDKYRYRCSPDGKQAYKNNAILFYGQIFSLMAASLNSAFSSLLLKNQIKIVDINLSASDEEW